MMLGVVPPEEVIGHVPVTDVTVPCGIAVQPNKPADQVTALVPVHEVRLAPLKLAVNNLELEAVVAKDVVLVALVVVELSPVKFWSVLEPVTNMFPNVWRADHVFALARFNPASTIPVVGEIVSVARPSSATEVTVPPPVPHDDPIESSFPLVIWTQPFG